MMTEFEMQPGDVLVHGLGPKSDWVSRQIAKQTASPWTHVALAVCERRLIEAWWPRTRVLPRAGRLAQLEAARMQYCVLRPARGVTYPEALVLTQEAERYIGVKYPWWQIALYAVTGWFWTLGKSQVICSKLVPTALAKAGLPVWDERQLRLLPGATRTQLLQHWASPADLARYGAFTVVHQNPTYPS